MTLSNLSIANTAVSNQTIQQIQAGVKEALELVMGDSSPETLDEMSSIFLEDAIPLINQMKDGINSQNLQATSMAAHALKGSSATIGLTVFANACLAVETSSKAQDTAQARQHLASLAANYTIVEQALKAFLL